MELFIFYESKLCFWFEEDVEDLLLLLKVQQKSPAKPQQNTLLSTEEVRTHKNVKELTRKRPFSYFRPIAELGEVSPSQKGSLSGKKKSIEGL